LRVGTVEIRVHTADAVIDIEAEKAKLDKDIAYNQGFMRSVQAKLSNERFIAGAPDKVIDIEKRKLADAKAKLEVAVSQRAALD
jgi:valyl-tRNA synthetase